MSFEQKSNESDYDRFKKEETEFLKNLEEFRDGTAGKLLISLKKAIELNNKTMEAGMVKNGQNKHDERKVEATRKLTLEKVILSNELFGADTSGEIFKEITQSGENIDINKVEQRRKEFSALKMYDVIQKMVDHLEQLKEKGEIEISFVATNNIKIKIDNCLEAAKNLQNRLIDEGRNSKE
ncbi:MAG: hypothetical protein ABH951_03005 [Patescibacteria group bacterium]